MTHAYETSDLGLASTLSCLGFRILDLDRAAPRRVIFRFQGEAKELEQTAQSYWDGSLRLPPAALFTHQKLLKQRIYGEFAHQ
jgi:hypothetical protein